MFRKPSIPPVSYTHLDVYKRQQLLQGRSIGKHHTIDGLEVLRRHLAAEGLERARIRFVPLTQGLIRDVGEDRGEVRGGLSTAIEELRICLLYTSRCV